MLRRIPSITRIIRERKEGKANAGICGRAIAEAMHELGLLDSEVAVKVYGFNETTNQNAAIDSGTQKA